LRAGGGQEGGRRGQEGRWLCDVQPRRSCNATRDTRHATNLITLQPTRLVIASSASFSQPLRSRGARARGCEVGSCCLRHRCAPPDKCTHAVTVGTAWAVQCIHMHQKHVRSTAKPMEPKKRTWHARLQAREKGRSPRWTFHRSLHRQSRGARGRLAREHHPWECFVDVVVEVSAEGVGRHHSRTVAHSAQTLLLLLLLVALTIAVVVALGLSLQIVGWRGRRQAQFCRAHEPVPSPMSTKLNRLDAAKVCEWCDSIFAFFSVHVWVHVHNRPCIHC
jgi:hypothetical protein